MKRIRKKKRKQTLSVLNIPAVMNVLHFSLNALVLHIQLIKMHLSPLGSFVEEIKENTNAKVNSKHCMLFIFDCVCLLAQ